NIDADASLEIIVPAQGNSQYYAWNSNGSLQDGWPLYKPPGTGYPTLGNLSNAYPGLEVFSGHLVGANHGSLVAYSGCAITLTGWPRLSANGVSAPAALGDVDGDGLDEIFLGEEDW